MDVSYTVRRAFQHAGADYAPGDVWQSRDTRLIAKLLRTRYLHTPETPAAPETDTHAEHTPTPTARPRTARGKASNRTRTQ